MLLSDHLLPAAALVDFELTLTCPATLTSYVGLDALTHAIEAYVSRAANHLTDLCAIEALRLLSSALPRVHANPTDSDARERLALGATLAGIAFSNASVALVHGMSRPLGAHFHIAHGLSNAVLLPTVTRFSLDAAPQRYARIAREVGAIDGDESDAAAGAALADWLDGLGETLEVPRSPIWGSLASVSMP